MRDLVSNGISPEYLAQCFDYDDATGNLTWKVRPLSHFKTKAAQVSVNNRFAKKIAGFTRDGVSIAVKLSNDWFHAHEIIFTMVRGRTPVAKLVHLNGNALDNRAENIAEFSLEPIDESNIDNPGLIGDNFNTTGTLRVGYLRECLDYDPDSGLLTWKERPRSHFKGTAGFKNYHQQFAGKDAGFLSQHGYLRVLLSGRRYPAHRLCFAIYHGSYPNGMIDHINGDRADNRINNLRCVDRQENMRNMAKYSNNTSGYVGVCLRKDNGKFRAFINDNNKKRKWLGTFDNLDDAIQARKEAEVKYQYHENHGR
ncbi:HNH endonuclease [Scandinavium manionii]|uniref:HNH endonuclease n=1 Tax=Scandinavium manionii TaxID=2926520 RepID=UPI002166872D|nr:HNH endonuclease [Scandinavium manionii]MCS2167544.1 HNH endonuclease [Scandinavium manionii]